ncbi:MAG: hypothetical protein P8J33_08140, partial [Pirellulaceae bacterium]|nr:hypothetical protein [Pirellulaceae bacterium]
MQIQAPFIKAPFTTMLKKHLQRLFKLKFQNRLSSGECVQDGNAMQADIDYCRLEPRRVLNASFTFNGVDLDLSDFTEDVTFSEGIFDPGLGPGGQIDAFIFELTSGIWNDLGGGGGGVYLDGSTLAVDTAGFMGMTNIQITGDNTTGITQVAGNTLQANQFTINSFNTSNDINFNIDGDVTVTNLQTTDGSISLTSTGDLFVASLATGDFGNDDEHDISLITTSGAITVESGGVNSDNDLLISSGSNVTLNGELSAGSGAFLQTVRLIANGDVTQAAASTIFADQLGVRQESSLPGGDIQLTLGNIVNDFAAFNASSGGEVLFNSILGLSIDTINADDSFAQTQGITTTDGDVKLTTSGNLEINDAITVGTGDLFLMTTGGNVTQAVAISGAGLGLMVDGTTTLQNGGNEFATIAADNSGETLYTDASGLAVGSVTVDGMTVTGINTTTSNSDVKLTTSGDLEINDAITVGTGDLFLMTTGGNVTQAAAISGAGLGLMVDGTTTLQNGGNEFATIAADNSGETLYTDASGLAVGSVTVDGMTVTGISTSDDDVKLTTSGNLEINDAITLGAGNLFLMTTGGDVTQSADGDITALGLGLMVGGTTRLDNPSDPTLDLTGNDVTNFAADNNGLTIYRDLNDLFVSSVTVDGMTVTGIETSDDDVKLILGRDPLNPLYDPLNPGDLQINEAITLGAGNLFLMTTGGDVTQSADGDITALGLGLMVGGTTR